MRITTHGTLVGLVASAVAAALLPSAPDAARASAGPDFPAAVLGVAHLAVVLLAVWVLLVLGGALVHLQLPGVPRRLRRLLVAPVAVTAVTVVAVGGPAHAEGRHDLSGLALPDRPTAAAADSVHPAAPTAPAVTVRAGDTLWSIAGGDDWPEWYAANRDVIGPDPDLIRPGQVLTPPEKDAP